MSEPTASPWLPSIFSDNMVLQRDVPIPVWGRAEPGGRVVVRIGELEEYAIAGPDGRWVVELEPMAAGGPFELTIEAGESRSFSNVMVGEVWVCSGQSNMQWAVRDSMDAEAEIAGAARPLIRLFTVPNVVAETPLEDCGGEWQVCSPETVPGFSAAAYFFGRELGESLGVPIGLINTSWGGTPAQSWTSRPMLESGPVLAGYLGRWDENIRTLPDQMRHYEDVLMPEWRAAVERAQAAGEEPPWEPWPPQGNDSPHRPTCLYNSMIAPLVPHAIRGAVWYQGESNVERAHEYCRLFSAMIEDWRRAWGQGALPFYFVQLANYMPVTDDPCESDWAELREAQLETLALENTGMAVIIDIGEADDIHPRNKQDVGKRLALWALAKVHGQAVAHSGPQYESMEIAGREARLRFRHTDGGLFARGGKLRGFAVAGSDRVFHWADARIDGDAVVVSSEAVAEPVAVRYAWANNPVCNLYNSAGLPASPFRTDDWPGVTSGR